MDHFHLVLFCLTTDPASIVQARSTVMVNEGSDAEFECRAAGNPLTLTTVSWRRAGFDMEGRTTQTPGVGVAYLFVKEITRNDTGAFECVANNGIGQESIEQTWLVVKCKSLVFLAPLPVVCLTLFDWFSLALSR